ncbi:tRNA (adenosine(37)-N6)-threonylcarbamoyltransferase complex transferase subunit TsaD [Mycoplasma wenyonii]|uniref:tRNA (adenosine(37)-N6)-threonylcarbamoyltransferase complex transferase subunit TsaD n=1 Tax=Mycoplasma wenyonii TaxID=65123 RepID=UPI0021AC774D|nr:tRNA (adenosine(37)-N6)-threonylcarbamoyltransferase complex transferase subunit TsaD [Mycoplasma wenyonii]
MKEKRILGESHYSSSKEHTKFGGIVPEIAARAHERHLIPLIENCLNKTTLKLSDINYIAYSACPGLESSLLVGKMIATTLSISLKKKLIPVNHLEAHVYSIGLTKEIKFPSLSLLISGKNTIIFLLKDRNNIEELEKCQDCALGESYDKIARIMGFEYPGGPQLEKYYRKRINLEGFYLTKRSRNTSQLSLNFSGLITSSSRIWRKLLETPTYSLEEKKEILSTSFQEEVLLILYLKLKYWAKRFNLSEIYCSGGVSRNLVLKEQLTNKLASEGLNVYFVDEKFSEDNGAMIAYRASLLL